MTPRGPRPDRGVLNHAKASAAIADLKRELMVRQEGPALFGNPRGDTLEGALANIEQTMFGDALYRLREEKATNLLYHVIQVLRASRALFRRTSLPKGHATQGSPTNNGTACQMDDPRW